MTLIVLLTLLIGFTIWADTAQSAWPKFSGRASVFGNDPAQNYSDPWDNCRPAIGGSCLRGGIAVNRPGLGWYESWKRYGGGWWYVCPPRHLAVPIRGCHLLRQTDAGPRDRTLDITVVTARRAWGFRVYDFPTDQGRWTLQYRGRKRPGSKSRRAGSRTHVRAHTSR